MERAIFAGGCFWCTEAIFNRIKGVTEVIPGYSGGTTENPDYETVSMGTTGHAETIQIKFDPKIISYQKLVEIFFKLHDPTTLNRQGADIGTQYRSAIFYRSEAQKAIVEKVREEFDEKQIYKDPIITEIVPLTNFFPAENYHRDYYDNNREAGYCRIVIDPKVTKLFREFSDETK